MTTPVHAPMTEGERRLGAWIGLPPPCSDISGNTAAVHECGHALAAVLLRVPLRRVTIDEGNPPRSGETYIGRIRGRMQHEANLQVAFAGCIAESLTASYVGWWTTDLRNARDRSTYIRSKWRVRASEPAHLRAAFEDCWALLQPWTAEIRELASKLAASHELSGRRVRDFVRAVQRKRSPDYWLSDDSPVEVFVPEPIQRSEAERARMIA